MKKIISALPALALAAAIAIPATAEIRWLETSYDFGVMREQAGRQTGSARFVNDGPDSTYISYVRPSCGCTDSDFTKDIVAPGDTATVWFTYNPVGRPGIFEKTVKVYTGDEKSRHVIKITGTVVGSPETLAAHYPVDFGKLRLSERLLDLCDVKIGSGRHVFIRMVNQSMDSITPQWTTPEGLSIDITPHTLGPGDIATMGIYLNSNPQAEPGEKTFKFPLSTPSDTTDIAIHCNLVSN